MGNHWYQRGLQQEYTVIAATALPSVEMSMGIVHGGKKFDPTRSNRASCDVENTQ